MGIVFAHDLLEATAGVAMSHGPFTKTYVEVLRTRARAMKLVGAAPCMLRAKRCIPSDFFFDGRVCTVGD